MRTARFLLPLALSVSLVGCDAWFDTTPNPDAMMDDGTMMGHSSAGMMDDGAMDAYGSAGTMDDDSMMEVEGDAMMKAESSAEGEAMMKEEAPKDEPVDGSYGAYSPSVLANGQTKVLFFHAPWCPTCKHADAQLTAWYATHPFPISTYKVDYDSETELKQRYGVTYQHTFILVDGQGKALKIMEGPTDAQLQALLEA